MLSLKKASVGVSSFQLLNKINLDSLTQGFKTLTSVKIQNYAPYEYDLEQLKIDLYTPSGVLLAKQEEPIKAFILEKSKSSYIKVQHHIKPDDFISLLEENNFIDENESVFDRATTLLSMDLSGVKLTAKGFVVIDGFTIEINELITL